MKKDTKKRILVWLLMLSLLLPLPGMTNVAHAESTPTPPSPPNLTEVVRDSAQSNHLIMWCSGWGPDGWGHMWRLSSNPDMLSSLWDDFTEEFANSVDFSGSLRNLIDGIVYLAVRYFHGSSSDIVSGWSRVYSVEINDNGEIINVEPYDPEGGGYTGHVCDWEPYTIQEPSCTEPGLRGYKCKHCGTIGNTTEEIPVEHDMQYVKTLSEATCTTSRIYLYRCSRCGYENEVLGTEAFGHEFVWSLDPEDKERYDCIEGGYIRKICDNCGVKSDWQYREPYPGGHQWRDEEFITTVEPTCTTKGEGYHPCWLCPARYKKEIPMVEHQYERKVKTQPTCTAEGVTVEVCKVCGQEKEGSEQTIDQLEHQYELKVNPAPTCTEAGRQSEICKICGEEKPGSAKVLEPSHQWERKTILEPKCLEYGKSIMKCAVCGAEDPATEERIDPPGHTWEERVIEEPTCAEKGWKQKICTVCGREGDLDLIDKLEHTWVEDEDKDPTCTEWGRLSGHCSVCGHTESLDLEPHGHDWEDVKTIREPNCKDAGVKLVRCRICNEEKEEAIPTNDVHDLVEEVSVEPTCTEWGKYRVYCKICGFETVKGDKPPNGHTEVPIEDRAFNCMQGGMVGATKCSVCGEILNQGVYRPAIGHHTWAQKVIEPSTCQKAGSYRRTCTVCSAEEIVPLPLAEHTWARGNIIRVADCAGEGAATRVCTACGALGELEIFPQTDEHNWVTRPGKEPSCTQAGYTESVHCDVCGKTQKLAESIPPAPHKEVTIHAMRPTATLEGRTEGIRCGRCGVWIVPCKTLPKLGSEGTEHNMTKESPPLTQGSDESAAFTSDADFQDFSHVTLNDEIVDESNYDAKEGSTIITFKPAFLKTLPVGKHTVKIVSTTGTARGMLEIKAQATPQTEQVTLPSDTLPKTGEISGDYSWLVLLLLSAGGLIFLNRKKRMAKQRNQI